MSGIAIHVGATIVLVPFACFCSERPMKTEKTIAEIQRQVAIGMPRVEVEQRIAKIPDVSSVYTSREHILPPAERVSGGHPLSGRITVSTRLEVTGLEKSSGFVVIEFDEQDRVVNLRAEGFGFKKQQ